MKKRTLRKYAGVCVRHGRDSLHTRSSSGLSWTALPRVRTLHLRSLLHSSGIDFESDWASTHEALQLSERCLIPHGKPIIRVKVAPQ